MSFRTLIAAFAAVFLLFCSISPLYSQTRVQNADGDWIIIMPDGTWQYDDNAVEKPAKATKKKKSKAKKPKTKKSKTPKTQKPKAKKSKAKKPKKSKTPKIRKESSNPAIDRSQLAASELQLEKAEADYKIIKRDVSAKKKEIAKAKSEPQKLRLQQELSVLNQRKKLAKANVKLAKKSYSTIKSSISKQEKAAKSEIAESQSVRSNKSKSSKKSRETQTIQASSPVQNTASTGARLISKIRYTPCSIAMRQVDPISGQTQINLQEQPFFSYTAPEMRKYMKGSDYLNCYAGLTRVGNTKLLNITYQINSKLGQKDYGYIEDESSLIIRLIDGSMITLKAKKQDEGLVDAINNKTTFKNSYLISAKDEKELRKYEVSFVRMVWSNGYEDYEVYELDFLIDMFDCLDETQ